MTAFTDVANPRRLIKSLRLTLCPWEPLRSEPLGARTSPVDLSLVGRDALFGESGEEKAPIRCDEAAKISQIDADGLGLHVREHRVQVDNLERAVVKRMPEIAREGRAAGVVAWVPDVQADELVGRVGPF